MVQKTHTIFSHLHLSQQVYINTSGMREREGEKETPFPFSHCCACPLPCSAKGQHQQWHKKTQDAACAVTPALSFPGEHCAEWTDDDHSAMNAIFLVFGVSTQWDFADTVMASIFHNDSEAFWIIFLMKVSLLLAAGNLCHRHFTFLESNFLTGRDLICHVMKSAFKALTNSTGQVSSQAMPWEKLPGSFLISFPNSLLPQHPHSPSPSPLSPWWSPSPERFLST